MLKLGSINSDEFNEAVNEFDEAKYFGSTSEVEADYVAEMVRQEVITKFGLDVTPVVILQLQLLILECRVRD